jgi:ABC-type dipeptide/oligopeptide/nickel transport system ATPase component
MLVATHDLSFAAALCTRYLVLVDGRMVDEERAAAVLRAWAD